MSGHDVVATLYVQYGAIVADPCDGVLLAILGKYEDIDFQKIAAIETEINRRIQQQVPFIDAQNVPTIIQNPVTEAMVLALNDHIAREFSDVLLMITVRPSKLAKILAQQ